MATLDLAPRKIYQMRLNLTGLPLYYEGFLWVKRPRSKEVKYWTELRGTKLFFYGDKKQEKFTDSMDLRKLSSANDRSPNQKHLVEVVLTLENEEVIIKTETAEDAEEWKGFILTVVQQSVPNWLTLLPGQLIRLKEVLEKEIPRRAEEDKALSSPSKPTPPDLPTTGPYEDVLSPSGMPLCFHQVSRQEAAEMLTKNESCGNLILRPGADCRNYAVTIREPSDNSRNQIKHYRIAKTDHGYTIELDKPVILNNLEDVVNHFVNETRGKLKPYASNIYDTQIDYALKNEETKKNNTPTSKVKLLANQLAQVNIGKRGSENAYVNVFPGN
ncbi:signal-transducing adaptor protein 1-like isoform X2 [Hyperolius riggenbachi]|uniref:signal-transducing adaptor protein 1-like isoform X2 n=1 Tax=Hyperolius riggenbachi TaxID=752182 RepID=UPI0035A2C55D